MTKLPLVSGNRLIDILLRCGFHVARIESSHYVLRDAHGRRTVVPVHKNEDVQRPLLRAILRQAGVSIEDYLRLLGD
jgi:predicted RNA binding protein YcfA (HicA-like mRNA interferase family)